MKKFERLLANLFLSLVSLVVVFAALECAAEIYLVHFSRDEVFRKYASLEQLKQRMYFHHLPHRYLGHFPSPGYRSGKNKQNSLGFRGDEIPEPKPKGEFRIVCLGGSTTYSGAVEDYRRSYPALLEKELKEHGCPNVRVINGGVNSYSSWETMINFEIRVLDVEPDMIITYMAINDVASRLVWPPSAYRGDNSGYMIDGSPVFMPNILEYSTLIRIALIKTGLSMPHNTLHSRADFTPTSYSDQFLDQWVKGIYPQGIFKKTPVSQMLAVNRPVYYKRNIENIVAIAKYRGLQVILCTFAYSPLFTNQPAVASSEYQSAIEEHNDITRRIAKETGVSLFNLAGVFPADKEYYVDGRHMTDKGDALRARLVAEYIIKNRLIPRPA